MNGTTTRKRIQPYDFRVQGNRVTIFNTQGQRLQVSRDQIIRQLQRSDLDAHRRVMYEGALLEIDRQKAANRCNCMEYPGDNEKCPQHGHLYAGRV